MVELITTDSKYLSLSYYMVQILLLKYPCEEILLHMYKYFKGFKINFTSLEDNKGFIYTDKFKNIYPNTKDISTCIHLFREHIYEEDTNTHGETILEKLIPRFTQQTN